MLIQYDHCLRNTTQCLSSTIHCLSNTTQCLSSTTIAYVIRPNGYRIRSIAYLIRPNAYRVRFIAYEIRPNAYPVRSIAYLVRPNVFSERFNCSLLPVVLCLIPLHSCLKTCKVSRRRLLSYILILFLKLSPLQFIIYCFLILE